MDAAVGLLGQQQPGDAVEHQPQAADEDRHGQHASDDEWVDAQPSGQPARDPADPALGGPGDPDPADRVEEGVRAASRRLGAGVHLRHDRHAARPPGPGTSGTGPDSTLIRAVGGPEPALIRPRRPHGAPRACDDAPVESLTRLPLLRPRQRAGARWCRRRARRPPRAARRGRAPRAGAPGAARRGRGAALRVLVGHGAQRRPAAAAEEARPAADRRAGAAPAPARAAACR